jgi:ubiquinone/menaquinone biosynthesis C-methylase UbiE
MGCADSERRRLALQAAILNPFTENLLRRAGLTRGMRVLDLGCGTGEVSLIAARLVGRDGAVTGVDVDARALDLARQRASDDDFPQVKFECRPIEDIPFSRRFDAVIGRHILVHMRDPIGILGRAAEWLRFGGVAAFHEFDFSFIELSYPPAPMRDELARLFAKFIPTPNMARRLYHDFLAAGFSFPQCRSLSLLSHVATADERFTLPRDVATLARRVKQEVAESHAMCPIPLAVTGHARRN